MLQAGAQGGFDGQLDFVGHLNQARDEGKISVVLFGPFHGRFDARHDAAVAPLNLEERLVAGVELGVGAPGGGQRFFAAGTECARLLELLAQPLDELIELLEVVLVRFVGTLCRLQGGALAGCLLFGTLNQLVFAQLVLLQVST